MDNYGQYLREFSEYALKNEARKAAQTLSIRSYDNGSSKDTRRNSTPDEANVITNCIYGALLTIKSNATIEAQKPAMDAAEMIADLSIPNLNGYDSVYDPVRRICEDFKAVSLRARTEQSDYYYNGYNIDRLYEQGVDWWIHRNGGNTLAYEDGSINDVRKNLEEYYISADDLRSEDIEAAEREAEKGLSGYEKGIGFDDDIEQETITALLNTFPETVYSHDINNNCIIIKWGEPGYYKTDYPEGGYTDEIIDEINMGADIVPAQHKAMEFCSMAAQSNPNLDWENTYKRILSQSLDNKTNEPIIYPEFGGRK